MIKATIRHTGIVVNNLQKSLDFWCNDLGFQVIRKMDESGTQIDSILGLKGTKLTTAKLGDKNGNQIELLKFHSHQNDSSWKGGVFTTGLTHIALNVNNLSELHVHLCNLGYKFNVEPQVSVDGLVKVTYMHGPEGLLLELVETN